MVRIEVDEARCDGCNFCVEFCPTSVFELVTAHGKKVARAARPEACWACNACMGQCAQHAISVLQDPAPARYLDADNKAPFTPLGDGEKQAYAAYAQSLERVLKLRWQPVAITLIPYGVPLPHVPTPRVKLRYCQALMAARRGGSLLMTAEYHSCADRLERMKGGIGSVDAHHEYHFEHDGHRQHHPAIALETTAGSQKSVSRRAQEP